MIFQFRIAWPSPCNVGTKIFCYFDRHTFNCACLHDKKASNATRPGTAIENCSVLLYFNFTFFLCTTLLSTKALEVPARWGKLKSGSFAIRWSNVASMINRWVMGNSSSVIQLITYRLLIDCLLMLTMSSMLSISFFCYFSNSLQLLQLFKEIGNLNSEKFKFGAFV